MSNNEHINKTRGDDIENILYPLLALAGVVGALMYFFGDAFYAWLNTALMKIAWGEYRILSGLRIGTDYISELIYSMQQVDPKRFPLARFNLMVEAHIYVILVPILIMVALASLVGIARGKFYRVFDYNSLKREMVKVYPQSWSVFHLNPWDDERARGAFTRSETAWEWCAKHGIIDKNQSSPLEARNTWRPDVAKKKLKQQIGPVFPTSIEGIMRLSWSTKTILAIMLSVLEGDKASYKYLIESSATPDWFRISGEGDKVVYSFGVPKGDQRLINDIIYKALTDSKQILPEARRAIDLAKKGKDVFYTNRNFAKAFSRHYLVQTVLMDIKRNIPMFSINECLWLKAIDSKLFYALDAAGAADSVEYSYNPGTGRWLIRALAPATAYRDERQKEVELRESLKKKLTRTGPCSIDRDKMMDEYSWDLMISAVYQELENTNWVHHSRYQDISEEDEINKLGGTFNYENQCYCVFSYIMQGEGDFVPRTVQFFDELWQQITPLMSMSPNGKMESAADGRRFILIAGSKYIKTTDIKVFRKVVAANRDESKGSGSRVVAYDMMSDIREVTNQKYFSWPKYVLESLAADSPQKKKSAFSIQIGDIDTHKIIASNITEELKDIYTGKNQ